jgi:acetamidase/formamidase
MTTHHFAPQHYHNTIGSHKPVLHIADGDTVITCAVDAGGRDSNDEQITNPGNPQTGPVFVEGTEPGDMLAVHFDSLMPNRRRGFSETVIAQNIVDPDFVADLPKHHRVDWEIDLKQRTARLTPIADASAHSIPLSDKLAMLTLPLVPMLGCFGVAPARGQAISTSTSGPHGGNMDYRGFVAGVTIYFPVFVPGALLHVGDGHATQGDGEIVGTGIEISFDLQFTVHVIKNRPSRWPRGENATHLFTVGNARPLDQCVQHATTEMLRWLQTEYGLNYRDASTLLGQVVEYDLGNIYDPAYTMVCKINKQWLPARE